MIKHRICKASLALLAAGSFALPAAAQDAGMEARQMAAEMRAESARAQTDRAQGELDRIVRGFEGFTLSREEKKTLGKFRSFVLSRDAGGSETAYQKAREIAQSPDSQFLLSVLELQLATQTGDAARQAKATDAILDSGKAPPAALATLYRNQGVFAAQSGNLAKAETAFDKAVAAAPDDRETAVYLAQIKNDAGKHGEALKLIETAIAGQLLAGLEVPPLWRRAAESTRKRIEAQTAGQ